MIKIVLKVLSLKMDPAKIRFIRKAVIKEWGAEIIRKIQPSLMLWEAYKVTVLSCIAVGYLETNCQHGNENSSRRRERRHFCLLAVSNAELSLPIFFVEPPVYSHWSHHRYRHHCTLSNIGKEFIAPLPILQRSKNIMSKFSKNIKTYKTKTDLKVLSNVVQNQWRC